jgi:NTE family protein
MFSFVDGDDDACDFAKAMVEKAGAIKLGWKGMQVLDNLNEDLGLNPGRAFLDWMTQLLKAAGVESVADLDLRMTPRRLKRRDGTPIPQKDCGAKLAVVAADISTETKVEFPLMADLYYQHPSRVSPAVFVRASMSIPAFFHPLRVEKIPQGNEAKKRWRKKAGYEGKLPQEVLFVDGGIMSNFPIDLFHGEGEPLAPTFGAKLGVDRTAPSTVEKPLQLLGAIFNAARHCADYDFLTKNPDYRHLVSFIDTGDHNWLDFFMGPEAKIDLFVRGVKAGVDFLIGFDWDKYKKVRRDIAAKS